jgi:hypothetical protein
LTLAVAAAAACHGPGASASAAGPPARPAWRACWLPHDAANPCTGALRGWIDAAVTAAAPEAPASDGLLLGAADPWFLNHGVASLAPRPLATHPVVPAPRTARAFLRDPGALPAIAARTAAGQDASAAAGAWSRRSEGLDALGFATVVRTAVAVFVCAIIMAPLGCSIGAKSLYPQPRAPPGRLGLVAAGAGPTPAPARAA